MKRTSLDTCRFRHSIRRKGATEDAVCGWLQAVTGLRGSNRCRVARDACMACIASGPPSASAANPVVASLLYRICDDLVALGGAPGCSVDEATSLKEFVELALAPCQVEPSSLWGCDVVICCADSAPPTEQAIRSALEQDGAIPIIHLIDDGGGGTPLVAQFARHWNVVVHRNPNPRGLFATLHELVPELRTEFVAIQEVGTISHRDRLATSVAALVSRGAEILAAPLVTPAGTVRPREPGRAFRRDLPTPTLVFRRAALLDMGGFADRPADADVELVHRAAREGRAILVAPEATVTAIQAPSPSPLGPPPRYRPRMELLDHHARGFPRQPVECDVVLPFHGHLPYVREALTSILEQERAEAIVHLIDDATSRGGDELLRYWGSHPRVRTYRNIRNIGQFQSFNNVFPYFETGLVAVQDADDISRPDRLHQSGNLLRLADADVFGGRSQIFGAVPAEWSARRKPLFAPSVYPYRGAGFFLENPTAMFRVAAFEAVRGFADYGDLDCNKCGLDTEFYARAFYSGARFAISRRVVVDYRVHGDSAVRNSRTGFGSESRLLSEAENHRRFHMFQRGPFDPRILGALRAAPGVTERLGHRHRGTAP
jgi:Glycosyl transferase family 2